MRKIINFFLIVMIAILVFACENSTRSISRDKDLLGTGGDTDNIASEGENGDDDFGTVTGDSDITGSDSKQDKDSAGGDVDKIVNKDIDIIDNADDDTIENPDIPGDDADSTVDPDGVVTDDIVDDTDSFEQPDIDTFVCTDECLSGGQTDCASGQIRVCETDANSCLKWGTATNCASGFCQDATQCGTCNNLCPAEGTIDCAAGLIKTCQADTYGCLAWGTATSCASGFCQDSSSCGTCNNTCSTSGESQCASGKSKTCDADVNGCLAWSADNTCSYSICFNSSKCMKTVVTKQWGTDADDTVWGLALDSTGNPYITGQTNGGMDGNSNAGGTDIFLTKWNTMLTSKAWTKQLGTGTTNDQWGSAVGGSGDDAGRSVVVSGTAVYVTGFVSGDYDGNGNSGDCKQSADQCKDIFLTKWGLDGTKEYSKQWGTNSHEGAYGIAADSTGNVFVAGYSNGDLDGVHNQGNDDIFLSKWKTDASREWTKMLGSNSNEYSLATAVDSAGNIFVAGYATGDLDGGSNQGGSDIFLTKWAANGTKAWTKQWGTSGTDMANSVAVDASGNIYVTGYTMGALDGNTSAGGSDFFITKWNADGTKSWTKQAGSTGDDSAYSVTISGSAFYITGETGGSLDGKTSAGGKDVFLQKYDLSGSKQWTIQWGTAADDTGKGVAVDASGNIYIAGNTTGAMDGNTNAGGNDAFLSILSKE